MNYLLNVKEVGALLSVSESTIRRMVRDGELPSVRVRGSIRFTNDAVATYIETVTRS